MQAFHFDAQPLILPPGHRFPQHKYGALRERLARQLPALRLQPAPKAALPAVRAVHTDEYVNKVLHGGLSAAEQREIGFPWHPGMPVRALHSVGATLAATRAALAEGIAMNLGGGTHHASAAQGGGYCVFNDAAVAARWAQRQRGVGQVLVIDLDVHQGNGTASIFDGDPSVFTLSLHGAKNFPFRKVAGDLDVDLADHCGDAAYLAALDAALAEVQRRLPRPPELVFYLAGADPHEGDSLGRLGLSTAGMAARDARVFGWLRRQRAATVLLMAGGYPTELEALLDVQQATIEQALALWAEWNNAAPFSIPPSDDALGAAAAG